MPSAENWWFYLPVAFWCVFVFVLGLLVGSFLNVVVARLYYQKSLVWPGSHCFTCLRPLRWYDNLPLVGYLLLRGRCRFCGVPFSSRYLWVELATALMFLALFAVDVLSHASDGPAFLRPWHPTGLRVTLFGVQALPPAGAVVTFLAHAVLLSLLLAAALIDADHKEIPPTLTYVGTLIGLAVSTAFPWPYPADPALKILKPGFPWMLPESVVIPSGIMPYPFWEPPSWAPPGSHLLGLLNGLVGAAFGTLFVRAVKFLFELGARRPALGMGDADLLLMVGAFLGWQVVFVGFFFGAIAGLLLKIPLLILDAVAKRELERELPFGPGLALGMVAAWLAWPWMGDSVRLLFEPTVLGLVGGVMAVGLLGAGLLLRR